MLKNILDAIKQILDYFRFNIILSVNGASVGIKNASSDLDASLQQFLKLVPTQKRQTIKNLLRIEIEKCFEKEEPYFYNNALWSAYSGVLNQTPISATTEDYKLLLARVMLFMFFESAQKNGYIPSFRYLPRVAEGNKSEYAIKSDIHGDWTGKISIVRNMGVNGSVSGFARKIVFSSTYKHDVIEENILDTDEHFQPSCRGLIAIHHDHAFYVPQFAWIRSETHDSIETNLKTLENHSCTSRDNILNSTQLEKLRVRFGSAIIDADLLPRYRFFFGGSYNCLSLEIHGFLASCYFVDRLNRRYALLVVKGEREDLRYLVRWAENTELWQVQDTEGEYRSLPYPIQVWLTGIQPIDSKNQTVNIAQEKLLTQSKNSLNRVPNAASTSKVRRKLYLDGKKGSDRPNWKWGKGYPTQKTQFGKGDSEIIIVPSLKGDIFYIFKVTGELVKIEPFFTLGARESIDSWFYNQYEITTLDRKLLEELFANQ